jgi:hypothetical protein
MTLMFDPRRLEPRCATDVTLDAERMTSAATTEPATITSDSSRQRLVCQWVRTAQGHLACSWRQISANEPGESHWRVAAESLAPTQPSSPALTPKQWMALVLILAAAVLETVVRAWIGGG